MNRPVYVHTHRREINRRVCVPCNIRVHVRVLSSVSQGLPEFHFQPKMLPELGSQLLTASNYKG